MVSRLTGVTLVSFLVFTAAFFLYYQISYVAGDNRFREYVIVYRQIERVEGVEIDGRLVERRSYDTVAGPETSRWALVLPPVLINNALLAALLSVLAVRYSHRFSGPAYRMGREIQRALRGEENVRIRLRTGDELTELAEQVNNLIAGYEEQRQNE